MTEAVADTLDEQTRRRVESLIKEEEGDANQYRGALGVALTLTAVLMSLFHLYAAYAIVPAQLLRTTHVTLVLVFIFLSFPIAARFKNRLMPWDILLAMLAVATLVYAYLGGDDFTRAHFRALEGFFKQGCKRFRHKGSLTGRRVNASTIAGQIILVRRWVMRQVPRWVKNPKGRCASCAKGARGTGSSCAHRGHHLFALPPVQNLRHRFVDGERGVVQLQGILRGLQRCNAALCVTGVARFQVCAKSIDCSGKTL